MEKNVESRGLDSLASAGEVDTASKGFQGETETVHLR